MKTKNFNLFKNAANEATIEIFGDIGEDWWTGEGNTMQSVSDEINALEVDTIHAKIGSLGGSVFHGLGIYNVLRMHRARIVARIVAPTASAGTIVALAGDEVHMSDAATFLIHNTWTGAVGNAEELRAVADDLDTFDDRAVEIYQKKTGKRKSQLRSLMAEEKWLSPKDAKDWGFVDKITDEPLAIAASMLDKIQASNDLPKMPEKYVAKLLEKQNKKSVDMDDTQKQSLLDQIEARFKPFFDKIAGNQNESKLREEINAAKQEAIDAVEARAAADEAKAAAAEFKTEAPKAEPKAEVKAEAKEDDKLAALRAEFEGKFQALEDENKRLRGVESTATKKEDKENPENKAGDLWDAIANRLNDLRNRNRGGAFTS